LESLGLLQGKRRLAAQRAQQRRNSKVRNEELTAFPPSRSPQLFAIINSKIPVSGNLVKSQASASDDSSSSSSVSAQSTNSARPRPVTQRVRPNVYQAPYYARRPVQSPSSSRPLAQLQFSIREEYPQQSYSRPVGYRRPPVGYYPVRRPIGPSYYSRPYGNSPYGPYAAPIRRRTPPTRTSSSQGGYPKPALIAIYNAGGNQNQPGGYNYRPEVAPLSSPVRPTPVRKPQSQKRPVIHRRPTPVIKQDELDYYHISESQESPEVYDELPPYVPGPPEDYYGQLDELADPALFRRRSGRNSGKFRRDAKMTKKNKKKTTKAKMDTDPLGILEKINKPNKNTKKH